MRTDHYLKIHWAPTLLIALLSLNIQAQDRTSSAEQIGIVEFSGSQNSTNGIVYEVLPGPAVINPNMNPTPFSDSLIMSSGSYSFVVEDIDDVDSPSSMDSIVSVNIQFTGNDGQAYLIDNIMIIHKPDTMGDHTFYGGIGLNKMMHGNTGIGTGLMPKMMAYITMWGLVDLKDANTNAVIASNRILHLMVATNVRNEALELDTNVVTDGSDYNIKNAHTHVILPPLDMAGNMSPIPGTDHGFIHMMFEKPILDNANKDWTKVYEILPGPAVMNIAMDPTPFSDRVSIAAGSYTIGVADLDSMDSPNSLDSVVFVDITFERPNGDMFMIDTINIIHKPDGAGDHTFYGGVGYDKLMHGNTTIGTPLMPKMTAYITLWGLTNLKDGDGNILATNRIIHMMVASRVRDAELFMIGSAVIDSSDYDPTKRETHIILPPLDMAGNMSPVPGTGHGFLHLMFENVVFEDLVNSIDNISSENRSVRAYPNPFSGSTTIEYQTENNANVRVTIYSITGEEVVTLVNSNQAPGLHKVEFNTNGELSAGIYIYTIETEGTRVAGRLSLIDE